MLGLPCWLRLERFFNNANRNNPAIRAPSTKLPATSPPNKGVVNHAGESFDCGTLVADAAANVSLAPEAEVTDSLSVVVDTLR